MQARRITALVLASVMVLSASACKKRSSDKDEETASPGSAASYEVDPNAPSDPAGNGALPTTVVIPGSDRTDPSGDEPDAGVATVSAVSTDNTGDAGNVPEGSSDPADAVPSEADQSGSISSGADLTVFADAATRYYDTVDEIPLTAYEPVEFWYAMNVLCVCYGDEAGGATTDDGNELYYTDEQIASFADVMYCDYDETPDIPEGFAIRRADGGYYFECSSEAFTPAELISTEEDGESVIMTLRVPGGNAETGGDVYKYVRLFAADNPYSLAVSNIRVENIDQ